MKETVTDKVTVTQAAIEHAMSPMRFRWRQRFTNRVTSLFRTVRPQRSFRSADDGSDTDVGVRSMPSMSMSRYTKSVKPASRHASPRHHSHRVQEKQPEGAAARPTAYTHSAVDVSASRSKSMDRRPVSSAAASAGGFAGGVLHYPIGTTARTRRGSASLLALPYSHNQQQSSSRSFSPTPSTGGDDGTDRTLSGRDRPKSRFSLSSFKQWRPGRNVSYGPGPHEASTSNMTATSKPSRQNSSGQASTTATSPTDGARSSDEVSPIVGGSGSGLSSGVVVRDYRRHSGPHVTMAMRASSWGNVGEYSRQAEEVTSIHSGDREEAVDEEVMLFGASGVANGPLPPTPNGGINVPMSPVPNFSALDAVCLDAQSPPQSHHSTLKAVPHELLHSVTGRDPATEADPAAHDASTYGRGASGVASSSRPHAPSPLAHLSYSSEDLGQYDYDDDDDSSSFFERASEVDGAEDDGPLSTSQIFDDEDDESDEESVPLEVRRRRPSWSVVPPDQDQDSGEEEDEEDDEDDEDDEDEVDVEES